MLDRLDVAFRQVEAVLEMNNDNNAVQNSNNADKFYGKLFPMTVSKQTKKSLFILYLTKLLIGFVFFSLAQVSHGIWSTPEETRVRREIQTNPPDGT